MYFTYVLRSLKDGKRYIGYTADIRSRLRSHNLGLTHSTRNRRPFRLICFKQFDTKLEAINYERYLKRLKGGKQLEVEINKMLSFAYVAQLVEQLHGKE